MHGVVAARAGSGRPLLAVCLSHQILAGLLGLPLEPLAEPYQGTQRRVRAFGQDVRVGFYNTYTARARQDLPGVAVSADARTREVVALRGPGTASVQFHLESILSADGVRLLTEIAADLLANHTEQRSRPPYRDIAR